MAQCSAAQHRTVKYRRGSSQSLSRPDLTSCRCSSISQCSDAAEMGTVDGRQHAQHLPAITLAGRVRGIRPGLSLVRRLELQETTAITLRLRNRYATPLAWSSHLISGRRRRRLSRLRAAAPATSTQYVLGSRWTRQARSGRRARPQK